MKRQSLGLFAAVLAVVCMTLPTAHAAKEKFDPLNVHVDASTIELRSASGEIIRAQFESDVIVSFNGRARGSLTFIFADGSVLDYRAVEARVEFDAAGDVRRVWLSLVTQSHGVPGFAVASIVPEAAEDCLIYDILGPDVHDGEAIFEVPGSITALR